MPKRQAIPLSIQPKPFSQIVFFLLAFTLTWGIWIPQILDARGIIKLNLPVPLVQFWSAWGPSLAGILVTAIFYGRRQLGTLFRRLGKFKFKWYWYLFVLFWPAALSLAVTGIWLLLGNPPPVWDLPPIKLIYPFPPDMPLIGFIPAFIIMTLRQLLFPALGEEIGWRGFVLPRLQSKFSPLLASLLLGLVWGFYFLPQFTDPGTGLVFKDFVINYCALLLDSILYTWIFLNTGGSLVGVVLLHASRPVTRLFLASSNQVLIELLVTLVIVGLVVYLDKRMRTRLPQLAE